MCTFCLLHWAIHSSIDIGMFRSYVYLSCKYCFPACRPCPEGFVLGKHKQHLDHVVSKWLSEMREKLEQAPPLILWSHDPTLCECCHIPGWWPYKASFLDNAVSLWSIGPWIHPWEISNERTCEACSEKKISKQIVADGDLPETNTLDAYSTPFKKGGFADMYKTLWLEVKRKEL